MSQEEIVEIFLNNEDYNTIFEENDDEMIFSIFTDEIAKLSGERYFLPHHEYLINYKEKFCIFSNFEIGYETDEKIYTNYKIVLKLNLPLKTKKIEETECEICCENNNEFIFYNTCINKTCKNCCKNFYIETL